MNAQTIQEIAETQMYKGFSLDSIERAFDAIADPNDWKGPISRMLLGEEVLLAVAAIQFYTATTPTVTLDTETMRYHVTSSGYRAGPAGDH